MDFTLDGTTLIVLIVLVVVVIALSAWAISRRMKSRALRKEFGPEYDHEVEVSGSRGRAEDELASRRERVHQYALREIDAGDKERLASRWQEVQRRFVDQPGEAVEDAALLVDEAMRLRGYPMGEIQRREADLSVNHPEEVQQYRKAHEVAERNRRGDATTEDLREATVAYRTLFENLVGVTATHPETRTA